MKVVRCFLRIEIAAWQSERMRIGVSLGARKSEMTMASISEVSESSERDGKMYAVFEAKLCRVKRIPPPALVSNLLPSV